MIGQTLKLACEMYGYITSGIVWIKSGQQLQNGMNYTITTRVGSKAGQNGEIDQSIVSELVIEQAEEGDEGTYVCNAINTQVADTITGIIS